jgi:hypothetical protein
MGRKLRLGNGPKVEITKWADAFCQARSGGRMGARSFEKYQYRPRTKSKTRSRVRNAAARALSFVIRRGTRHADAVPRRLVAGSPPPAFQTLQARIFLPPSLPASAGAPAAASSSSSQQPPLLQVMAVEQTLPTAS